MIRSGTQRAPVRHARSRKPRPKSVFVANLTTRSANADDSDLGLHRNLIRDFVEQPGDRVPAYESGATGAYCGNHNDILDLSKDQAGQVGCRMRTFSTSESDRKTSASIMEWRAKEGGLGNWTSNKRRKASQRSSSSDAKKRLKAKFQST